MTQVADAATAAAPDESAQLEALFDSIAAASHTEEEPAPDGPDDAAKVISQIGHLTRGLHEALGQLGYDRVLQDVAGTMPDARQRLAYVATMTEQAAMRALNAIDAAQPIQVQCLLHIRQAAEKMLFQPGDRLRRHERPSHHMPRRAGELVTQYI